jgi:hypothetical protein
LFVKNVVCAGKFIEFPRAEFLRMPNVERAPMARMEICESYAEFWRVLALMPGARIGDSDTLTRGCPCWICSVLKASTETGKSKLDCSKRARVTTMGASRSRSPCAAEMRELNINAAIRAGFKASSDEIAELWRILRPPLWCFNLFLILSSLARVPMGAFKNKKGLLESSPLRRAVLFSD